MSGITGLVTADIGAELGNAIGPTISGLTSKIASPVLRQAATNAVTTGGIGFALGTAGGLISGQSLGASLGEGARGGAQGLALGAITGAAEGIRFAKQNDFDLWTGERRGFVPIEQPQFYNDVQITNADWRTEPAGLSEQLAMEQARTGAGESISPKRLVIKDPKYTNGEWIKKQYIHVLPDNMGKIIFIICITP